MNTSIHPPKTPVTNKSNGVAMNTIPNVCKMPGSPFTPTPLPNIGRSGMSPKGYSRTVFIEGGKIAIDGATFGSTGDMASKPTGGGIVSGTACGDTKFIAPGTTDVRVEGKGVHLLGDPTFNNCGGAPNAATMAGVLQGAIIVQSRLLGVEPQVQEICDMLCECEAEKRRSENCLYEKMDQRERQLAAQGVTKAQVPYDMNPDDGGPPRPYMSRTQPWRGTRNWYIGGSRRPDAVIIRDPGQIPRGDNIKAVVEVKVGKTPWGAGQEYAYGTIAGGRTKVLELNDDNCKCRDRRRRQPQEVTQPVPKPVTESERETSARSSSSWGWAKWVGAAALTAVVVVAAVALAPELAVAGAAAAAAGVLMSPGGAPAGSAEGA